MENKINLFGKSFNFNTGAVVKWNNFSERKDFYGILIEMKESDVGGRVAGPSVGGDQDFGEDG